MVVFVAGLMLCSVDKQPARLPQGKSQKWLHLKACCCFILLRRADLTLSCAFAGENAFFLFQPSPGMQISVRLAG